MFKTPFFLGLLVALCVGAGELQAALVISFNPVVASAVGATSTDFNVMVTNNAASVNVNAMKFSVQLTGAGASFSIFDTPSTYRSTNQYVFNAPGDNFGVATDSQFLSLSVANTVATFNDTAIVPVLVNVGQNNFRTIATNESLLVGKLRVNFSPAISAPYNFQLAANAVSGTGNERGGSTANYTGSYSGFGLGSGTVSAKSMANLPFSPGTGFAFSITAVPEPSAFGLVGIALSCLAGLALLRRPKNPIVNA